MSQEIYNLEVTLKLSYMKNEMNQRSENSSALNEFTKYVIDDVEYLLPSVPDYPQYRFDGITVEVENSGCLNSETSNYRHLILPVDMTHRQLCVKVHGINSRRLSGEEECPVKVALYRKGCPTALFCGEAGPSAKDFSEILGSSKVLPGEYYLFVGNAEPVGGYGFKYMSFGNGYAYRFRVLEHGIRLHMPQIKSVAHFGKTVLRVYFNETINPEENWFSCEYYDESYRMIATPTWLEISNDDYVNIGAKPIGNSLLPGNYHILLYHNNQPKAHFSFEWSESGSSEIKREPLTPESAYYQLYRVVRKTPYGESFMNLCGCRQVKKQLLRYLSHHMLIAGRPHFVIGDGRPASDTIRTLFGILYPRSEYRTLSCLDVWYKLYTYEDVTELFNMFDRQAVIQLNDLSGLLLPESKSFAEHVLHHASYRDSIVVLYGTQQELDALIGRYPEWKNLMSKEDIWKLEPYTLTEKVRTVEKYLAQKHYRMAPETYQRLWNFFADDQGTLMAGCRESDIETWVQVHLLARQQQRVLSSYRYRKEDKLTILPEDVCEE